MKDKIRAEVLERYENIEKHDDKSMETFVELVMDKTTDAIIEEIKKELQKEFRNGTLKHDFIISPEYYLELKLKEAKQNFSRRKQEWMVVGS